MAVKGTGLPYPEADAISQPINIVDADKYSAARAWAEVAHAGDKIAKAGLDTWEAEEHRARVGYLADQEIDIRRKRTDMRDQFSNDPDGFDAAWKGFTDGKLSQADPKLVEHLKKVLGSEGNSAYSAILAERRARDGALDRDRISALTNQTGNDVIGAAMAGTLHDPNGQIAVGKYKNVLDTAVNSRMMSQEHADVHFDETMSKAEGELAARDGVQIYREKGYDAAVAHLRKEILENESLSLKGESRYRAFNRGLSAINLQRKVDADDRAGVVTDSRDLRNRIDSNQPYDQSEVRDILGALQRTGAAAEFHRLSVANAVSESTAAYRSGLKLREFAGAVASQRVGTASLTDAVKRFEGFTPTAQWDFKQYSSGYGTKGAPGETVDRATAEARLQQELGKAASIVDSVNPNLPAGARDALISLTFNAGGDWTNAELGARVRAGDLAGAKERFVQYNKAGGQVNEGLVRRRAEEVQWFDRGGVGEAPPVGETPYSGEVTKRVQQIFVGQAHKAWPEFKAMIQNGRVLDEEDFASIRYAANLSNDANWKQEVENLYKANQVGLAIKDLPAGQRQAVIDQARHQIGEGGWSVDSDTIMRSLDAQVNRQFKMVTDDPVGYSIERGQKPPDALDFSSSDAARAGVAQRVAMARGVAHDQEVAPGNPFRPADRATIAGAIATGKPEQASVAFGALSSVPDEMLTPALATPEIKAAVGGAARSTDATRYSAAMQFMDTVWARAPETAKHLFGEDSIHTLMTWQSNLRYMAPDQLAKEREKSANDPQVRERQKINEEKGRTFAREHKFDDIVGQFDKSWWITPGVVARNVTGSAPFAPVDGLTRDALMGDFETQFARRYADTLDKDKALEQTKELLATKWSRSDVNGGRLMLNSPETLRDGSGNALYPAIDGSWNWMKGQLRTAVEKEVGKPAWRGPLEGGFPKQVLDYTLIPDRQTTTEAQSGKPASYQIQVTDSDTGRTSILPRRFAFDPGEDVGKRRADFELQRARVLERSTNQESIAPYVPANLLRRRRSPEPVTAVAGEQETPFLDNF